MPVVDFSDEEFDLLLHYFETAVDHEEEVFFIAGGLMSSFKQRHEKAGHLLKDLQEIMKGVGIG